MNYNDLGNNRLGKHGCTLGKRKSLYFLFRYFFSRSAHYCRRRYVYIITLSRQYYRQKRFCSAVDLNSSYRRYFAALSDCCNVKLTERQFSFFAGYRRCKRNTLGRRRYCYRRQLSLIVCRSGKYYFSAAVPDGNSRSDFRSADSRRKYRYSDSTVTHYITASIKCAMYNVQCAMQYLFKFRILFALLRFFLHNFQFLTPD